MADKRAGNGRRNRIRGRKIRVRTGIRERTGRIAADQTKPETEDPADEAVQEELHFYEDAFRSAGRELKHAGNRRHDRRRALSDKENHRKHRRRSGTGFLSTGTRGYPVERAGAVSVRMVTGRSRAGLIPVLGITGILLFMAFFITVPILSLGAAGVFTAISYGAFHSEPELITEADLTFSEMEKNLTERLRKAPEEYPGYDEYLYSLDKTYHDPEALICYLLAKYDEIDPTALPVILADLFDEMYHIDRSPASEIRTLTYIDEEGNEQQADYVWTTLTTVLRRTDLEPVIMMRLTDDEYDRYQIYRETKGLLQVFASPIDCYWYNYIGSWFGYRESTYSRGYEYHPGLDLAVPAGLPVSSGITGTVTGAGTNSTFGSWLAVSDGEWTVKYGHLEQVMLKVGDPVSRGDVIGVTAHAGTESGMDLHLECERSGRALNPLFLFDAGESTLYGESRGDTAYLVADERSGDAGHSYGNYGSGSMNVHDHLSPDEIIEILKDIPDGIIREALSYALTHTGYPYSQTNRMQEGFYDCSSLVYRAYRSAGLDIGYGGTTAAAIALGGVTRGQEILSTAELLPGDLVFYSYQENGRYRNISHVVMYVGDGMIVEANGGDHGVVYWDATRQDAGCIRCIIRPCAGQ